MTSLNDLLTNLLGIYDWRWWSACVLLSLANMVVMYGLDGPKSAGGRVARTFAWLGMLCGVFAWKWDALGTLAYPLLLLSFLTLNVQYYIECSQKRRKVENPASDSILSRAVTSIVRNHDELPQKHVQDH